VEGGIALSAVTPSRQGRLLVILACVLGILATSLVLATLVLLAVDGHAEGLLALVSGAAVPVVLWSGWSLVLLARTRRRSASVPRPTARAELKIEQKKLESASVRWPPSGTITVFR
jgi:hypothetical protein